MMELVHAPGDRAIYNLPSLHRREAFERVAKAYPNHQVEMDAKGNIIVMPPVSLSGASRESEINYQLAAWNRRTKLGKVFSPQAVFRLPNGAHRMPDAAWMPIAEWNTLPEKVRDTYEGVVVPWFAIEVMSLTNDYAELCGKCHEYVAQGVKEAWLIDCIDRHTRIFQPDRESVTRQPRLPGPPFMPDLIIDVEVIWDNI